jgi:hypothetical protein
MVAIIATATLNSHFDVVPFIFNPLHIVVGWRVECIVHESIQQVTRYQIYREYTSNV